MSYKIFTDVQLDVMGKGEGVRMIDILSLSDGGYGDSVN